MIGHWWINTVRLNSATHQDIILKTIFPYEDYGLYLIEYDAPAPKVRTYKAAIEGRNGSLDLTEWEGQGIVRYNDRTVTARVREIDGRQLTNRFIGEILGKRVNLHFDDDPEYLYAGRCENAETRTRKNVTDTTFTFTCQPFRKSLAHTVEVFEAPPRISASQPSITNFTISNPGNIIIPVLTISGVEDGYAAGRYSMLWWSAAETSEYYFRSSADNGEIQTNGLYLRPGESSFAITNANVSEKLVLTVDWQDEVI